MKERTMAEIPDVECIQETSMALLCVVEEDQVWIPKSQVDDESGVQEDGDVGTLIIPEWLAIEKGLV